jgi:o-succinylbenzoate synthase
MSARLSVASVELCPFLESFLRPVRSRAERAGWRVWITDELGRVGEGEAVCWPGFGAGEAATATSLEEGLAALKGFSLGLAHDGSDLRALGAWFEERALAPEARHALETALLDLLGQIKGVPLACVLGPLPRTQVWSQALVSDVAEARAARARGFRHFKLKVGAAPVAQDLARVAEVREALGPRSAGVELRLDANGRWTRAQAAEVVETAQELELSWLEQPLAPSDLEGLAELRRRGARVAIDEGLRSLADLEAHLAAEALDAAVLKPAFLGGPLVTLELARRAAEAGLEVMVTHALDGEVGRLAAFHVALAAPGLTLAGLSPALQGDRGPSGPRWTVEPGPWLPEGVSGSGPKSARLVGAGVEACAGLGRGACLDSDTAPDPHAVGERARCEDSSDSPAPASAGASLSSPLPQEVSP